MLIQLLIVMIKFEIRNYTGKAAARYILDQAGLYEVEIRGLPTS